MYAITEVEYPNQNTGGLSLHLVPTTPEPDPSQITPSDRTTTHSQTESARPDDPASPVGPHDLGIPRTSETRVVSDVNDSFLRRVMTQILNALLGKVMI